MDCFKTLWIYIWKPFSDFRKAISMSVMSEQGRSESAVCPSHKSSTENFQKLFHEPSSLGLGEALTY